MVLVAVFLFLVSRAILHVLPCFLCLLFCMFFHICDISIVCLLLSSAPVLLAGVRPLLAPLYFLRIFYFFAVLVLWVLSMRPGFLFVLSGSGIFHASRVPAVL